MNRRLTALIVAMGAAVGGTALAQDYTLTEPEVVVLLEKQGYSDIAGLKFRAGMWETTAKNSAGEAVNLRVDSGSGHVYPEVVTVVVPAPDPAALTKAEVEARLIAKGWHDVHDIEFKDGVWKAEARDATGDDKEIRLDPRDGAIVAIEED
jgi:hypothetical protein